MIIKHVSKTYCWEEIASTEYAVITKKGDRLEGMYGSRLIHYQGKPAILGESQILPNVKRLEKERQTLLEETSR